MGTLLLFSPLRPISRGGSTLLPPLPLAGLLGQIKACREDGYPRTRGGEPTGLWGENNAGGSA